MHGAALAVERVFRNAGRSLPIVARTALVFALVCALWIPFRSADFAQALQLFAAFTRLNGYAPTELASVALALVAIGLAMNWLPLAWLGTAETLVARLPAAAQASLLSLGIWVMFAIAQEGVAPFIYFQF